MKRLVLILIAVFITISYFAFNIQISEGNQNFEQANSFLVSRRYEQPRRGLILDRNGNILADNIELFDIYLAPSNGFSEIKTGLLEDLRETKLNPIITYGDMEELEEGDNVTKIYGDLSAKQVSQFEQAIGENEFIEIVSGFKRRYHYPKYFSHIIGYTGAATEEDVEAGLDPNDQVGRYRLEKQLDEELAGQKSSNIQIENSNIRIDGQEGDNVHLTIDLDWQKKMYEILEEYSGKNGAAGGAGIIMDVETGEIITQVSYPGFDMNDFVLGIGESELKKLEEQRNEPLKDKAISEGHEPGSIFKLISSYALLSQGIIVPSSTYFSSGCEELGVGFRFCEFNENVYGTLDYNAAIYKSSNLYFCNYVSAFAEQIGIDKFVNIVSSFNIGGLTQIDLNGEAEGNLDYPEYKKEVFNDNWYQGDTCNLAIGQGSLLLTPIQTTSLIAAIENDGWIVRPQVIGRVTTSNGRVSTQAGRSIINSVENTNGNTFEIIRNAMREAAYNPGSALAFMLNKFPGNDLRVKTGTSETVETLGGVNYPRSHGWIIGSFSHDGKTYAFSIFQKYGGGGFEATPILEKFLEWLASK